MRGTKLFVVFGILLVVFFLLVQKGVRQLKSDIDFERYFSEKQHSLILGTSVGERLRAPLITGTLNGANDDYYPLFNFAFDLTRSRFGPLYSKRILEKLKEGNDKKRVFIICVDPWNVSSDFTNPNDTSLFVENDNLMTFDKGGWFDHQRYFLSHYKKPLYTLFFEGDTLDINRVEKPSEELINKFQQAKIEYYKANYLHQQLSIVRIQSLKKLLKDLKKTGNAYLIRMPVSRKMIELENEYAPDFDELLLQIAKETGAKVIDFMPIADHFTCPDGNHLYDADADTVSLMIGEMIRIRESGQMDGGDELLSLYLQYEGSQFVPHKLRESLTLVEDEK